MYYLRRTYDVAAVRDMHAVCFPTDSFDESRVTAYWFMWQRGKDSPVGFCMARRSERYREWAFLSRAGVLKEARGRGLQRAMIDVRLRWAKRQGLKGATTYVALHNKASLINLLKCGFALFDPFVKGRARWRRTRRDGFLYLALRFKKKPA